jgi:hypothetical protein
MHRALACIGLASLLLANAAVADTVQGVPFDPRQAAADSDRYAWRLFLAVNKGAGESAAAKGRSGVNGPVVWETWMNATQIFLEDGRDPGPWVEQAAGPEIADAGRFEASSLKSLPNLRHIVDGRMVPLDDPVSEARRLTEVRMNRAAFEYVRALGLYCIEGQLAAAERVAFPPEAVEIKAHWRPVEEADRSRYHVVEVRSKAGKVRLYGLTALHIASKVLSHWFWATFEHADNAASPKSEGWRTASRDRFACAGPPDCGQPPGGLGLEGTLWWNYRLRGTMTDYLDVDGKPALLANSELESGFQLTSSCITCHARSSIGVVDGEVVRLPVFRSVDLRSDGIERVGYVGLPGEGWFYGADRPGGPWLRPLDFVWSLSLARHRRPS